MSMSDGVREAGPRGPSTLVRTRLLLIYSPPRLTAAAVLAFQAPRIRATCSAVMVTGLRRQAPPGSGEGQTTSARGISSLYPRRPLAAGCAQGLVSPQAITVTEDQSPRLALPHLLPHPERIPPRILARGHAQPSSLPAWAGRSATENAHGNLEKSCRPHVWGLGRVGAIPPRVRGRCGHRARRRARCPVALRAPPTGRRRES
mmetsp:Transcript_53300/g.130167  ORF Transcript_53300/g.130167 Transcript_53300/m.130167 type:complete len:203 (+) Transcript_53300:450-1058(+)